MNEDYRTSQKKEKDGVSFRPDDCAFLTVNYPSSLVPTLCDEDSHKVVHRGLIHICVALDGRKGSSDAQEPCCDDHVNKCCRFAGYGLYCCRGKVRYGSPQLVCINGVSIAEDSSFLNTIQKLLGRLPIPDGIVHSWHRHIGIGVLNDICRLPD